MTENTPTQRSNEGPLDKPSLHTQKKRLNYPFGPTVDRDRQARKLDRMIRLTGLAKYLETEESRREFIDSLSSDDFIKLLKETYGVLLNLPQNTRQLDDSVTRSTEPGTRITLDVHPAGEDKHILLQKVLEAAQGVSKIEDKAMIIAVGINAVHPFPDGNGRISRLFYYILTNGYHSDDKKLLEIISSSGEELVSPDPSLIRPAIMGTIELELGTHKYYDSAHSMIPVLPLTKIDQKFGTTHETELSSLSTTSRYIEVATILSQKDFGDMIPLLAINAYPKGRLEAARKAIIKKGGVDHFAVDIFLNEADKEDLDTFYEVFRSIKIAYTLNLIHQLTLGNKSLSILHQASNGKLKQWPIAELMKAHLAERM